jgi:hypothetical protein
MCSPVLALKEPLQRMKNIVVSRSATAFAGVFIVVAIVGSQRKRGSRKQHDKETDHPLHDDSCAS